MYVRLPDDYKFGTISAEEMSAALSAADVPDAPQSDSPVTEPVSQSLTDDVNLLVAATLAARRVARRASASLCQSAVSAASHFHSPRFQRRRTPRRRVAVSSSFITMATTDTDSGLYNLIYKTLCI